MREMTSEQAEEIKLSYFRSGALRFEGSRVILGIGADDPNYEQARQLWEQELQFVEGGPDHPVWLMTGWEIQRAIKALRSRRLLWSPIKECKYPMVSAKPRERDPATYAVGAALYTALFNYEAQRLEPPTPDKLVSFLNYRLKEARKRP